MRLATCSLLCAGLLTVAHFAALELGRAPATLRHARTRVVRSYYHLSEPQPRVDFFLPPGRSELKVRVHSVGRSRPTAPLLMLSTYTLAGEPIQPPTLLGFARSGEVLLNPRFGSNGQIRSGWGQVRLLTASMPTDGGLVRIERPSRSPDVLIRLARRASLRRREQTSRQPFTRVAALGTLDEPPPVVTLTHPRSSDDPQVRERVAQHVKRYRRAYYSLANDGAATVRAKAANPSGGVMRIRCRLGVSAVGSSGSARLNIALSTPTGVVRHLSDVVRSPRDPKAAGARMARLDRGRDPPLPAQWTEAIDRYVEYFEPVTQIEAWSTGAASTPILISFASWGGPRSGARPSEDEAFATPPLWQTIAADNHQSLRRAGRLVWLTSGGSRAPARRREDGAFKYIDLAPGEGAGGVLLSPVAGKARTAGKARVRHGGERICITDQGDGRGNFRIRAELALPRRVGARLNAWIGNQVFLSQELMAPSVVLSSGQVPAGCHVVRFTGVEPDDELLVDADLAPEARSFARTKVWSLNPGETLRFPVQLSRRSRVTVSLYSSQPAPGTLRAVIDEGRPKRRARGISERYTPPVVERDLRPLAKSNLRLAHDPQTPTAAFERVTLDLQDDLKPGGHNLTLAFSGKAQVWLRASLRKRISDDSGGPK